MRQDKVKEVRLTMTSIDSAIRGLLQFRMEFLQKIEEFEIQLAYEGIKVMAREFGGSNSVTYRLTRDNGDLVINAEGEAVVFLEFGTGALTDSNHEFANNVPLGIEVRPGSWSEEHADTWRRWIESGNDPMLYPYNFRPRYGMLHGFEEMKSKVFDVARRVFG